VLSTGTWIIGFNPRQPLERLDPRRDMVSNTDALGRPMASSRYMGGRELAVLCGPAPTAAADPAALARVVARGILVLPSVVDRGGPFPGCRGGAEGPLPGDAAERASLAALYTALCSNTCLDLLGADGEVVIEGSFAGNPVFGAVIAALRPARPVFAAAEPNGTAVGAAMLARWDAPAPDLALKPVAPAAVPGLESYARTWRDRAEAMLAGRG
jgi:sugar (pentulose or hexulose) kinase